MKRIAGFLTVCVLAAAAHAGNKDRLGVTDAQNEALSAGWSAKKDLMNKPVENGQKQRIGRIEDVIVTEKGMTAVIISTGGFVGIDQHDVAIPVSQLKFDHKLEKFMLPGVSKDELKALPEFKYPAAGERGEKKSDSM